MHSPFKHGQYKLDDFEVCPSHYKLYNIFDFDGKTRAKYWGYPGAHTLYRDTSSDVCVPDVQIPFLVMVAKDDPITKYCFVPRFDLLKNPNILLIEANHGGHCEYFSKTRNKSAF